MSHDICDMKLWESANVESEGLVRGDIIFCRNDGPLSWLIGKLNGYWSHSALNVGDGQVVHATQRGIVRQDLASLKTAFKGHLGLGRRAGAGEEVLDAVVEFALERLTSPPGDEEADVCDDGDEDDRDFEYDKVSLGLAAAVLLRSNLRFTWHEWFGGQEPSDDQLRRTASKIRAGDRRLIRRWKLLPESDRSWTCAGLVHAAYKHADYPISPEFGRGVHHVDEMVFGIPEEETEVFELAKRSLGLDESDNYVSRVIREFGPFLYQAIPQLRFGFSSRVVLPETSAVGPGDLWLSDEVERRGFLSADAKDRAHEESVRCGEGGAGS